MVGAVSPAARATSVNCALNGRPEAAGRAWGFTPREATPWANAFGAAAAEASESNNARREIFMMALTSRNPWWQVGHRMHVPGAWKTHPGNNLMPSECASYRRTHPPQEVSYVLSTASIRVRRRRFLCRTANLRATAVRIVFLLGFILTPARHSAN